MRRITQCIKCIHRTTIGRCLAYPDGIPYKFMSEEIPHKEKFDDQVGHYVYIPKEKYIEYDLKLKEKYKISLSEIEALKTKIAQLYYDALESSGFISENWESAILDFELIDRYGQFNELSVVTDGSIRVVDEISSYELIKKIRFLLSIKANHDGYRRMVLKIFPQSSASFEFKC